MAGYLATAGRALSVDDERMSVLAGWDPDLTYWLTDVTREKPGVERWRRDQDRIWAPTPD